MLRIEGQLAFTKPHLWTVYFSPGTRTGSDHDKFTTEYNRPKIP